MTTPQPIRVGPPTPHSREEFLHRQNVANYTRLLASPQDETQRAMLLRLLADEGLRAKIAHWAPLYP